LRGRLLCGRASPIGNQQDAGDQGGGRNRSHDGDV
jgi:hypothetical protein